MDGQLPIRIEYATFSSACGPKSVTVGLLQFDPSPLIARSAAARKVVHGPPAAICEWDNMLNRHQIGRDLCSIQPAGDAAESACTIL